MTGAPDDGPPESDAAGARTRLVAITLDEASIKRSNPNVEHEREVAIYDIVDANHFEVCGRDEGPYTLHLSIVEDRLVMAIGSGRESVEAHGALTFAVLRQGGAVAVIEMTGMQVSIDPEALSSLLALTQTQLSRLAEPAAAARRWAPDGGLPARLGENA